jgi:YbbR domain-containing protein
MIRILTDNWKYKLGSVTLAGLLWLGVVEESELITSVLAPIQYQNVPKDLEMNSDVSDKVHLEIKGPASKLGPAVLADTRVLLDLSAVNRPGERTFPIDRNTVVLPSGVELDRASPSQVRLHFESRLAKAVPVRVRIRQRPEEGYEIGSQQVEPAQLVVVGPESRVARIETVETDSIDIDHLKDATEVFRVHAYLSDPQVRFVGDGKVAIRIAVKKSASPVQ